MKLPERCLVRWQWNADGILPFSYEREIFMSCRGKWGCVSVLNQTSRGTQVCSPNINMACSCPGSAELSVYFANALFCFAFTQNFR